jgi:hypothetical protein
MKQTFKNFWAHRRQNGFVLVEIALATLLSFYFLDYYVVTFYDTHLCRPATEFEHEHLVVAQTARVVKHEPVDLGQDIDTTHLYSYERNALEDVASLYAMRDEVRAMPEVQSAALVNRSIYVGVPTNLYTSEADSTHSCMACTQWFASNTQYVETLGLTPVEGSPSASELSTLEGDSVIISRSLALALFDTDQAVGRHIIDWEREYDHGVPQEMKVRTRFTVAGVVEDFRGRITDRYSYNVLIPEALSTANGAPTMIIRLKPDTNADAFVTKMSEHKLRYAVGSQALYKIMTYPDFIDNLLSGNDNMMLFDLMWTFIGLLLVNVVIGTLGTFWLQIRKRTEDIGIMRSFGAKRRNIFWMLWREAALLTFIAVVIGQIIWLQFAMNIGLAHGFTMSGTGQETDWVNTFWLHYLIVCAIQYVLLLIIVTLGMVVPTFRAMYKRPVEALHHE